MGRPLVEKLVTNGHHIRLLVMPDEYVRDDLNRINFIRGDINNANSLKELLKGVEIVFHLAGKVHESNVYDLNYLGAFGRINIEGTDLLLKECRNSGVKRVVFYSTVGVYGKDGDFHGDETSPCKPLTAYAKSKIEAESIVLKANVNGGTEGVVLRFPIAYGPYDRGNIARLIKTLSKGLFVYFGDGLAARSMISSFNAAEAAYLAGLNKEAAGKIYCVTDDLDHTVKQLIDTILGALGIDRKPLRMSLGLARTAGKLGDLISNTITKSFPLNSAVINKLSTPLTFSCKKIKSELGYCPSDRFRKDIEDEVGWVLGRDK